MKKHHLFCSIVALPLLCLFLSDFLLRAQTPPTANPDFVDALWVAHSDAIRKIATADGQQLLHIPNVKNVQALAVDEPGGVLWSYQQNTLWVYRFDGEPLRSIALAPHGDNGNGPDLALRVNHTNGSAWLAVKKTLYHLGPQGEWLGIHTLPEHVRALSWDPLTGCVWVGTQKTVYALHDTGHACKTLDLGHQPDVQDLAVDPHSGALWIGMQKGLRRYAADGHLEFERPIGKVASVASDHRGGAWVATDKSLIRLDAHGRVLFESGAFAGPEKIVALAVDPTDASVWVASKKQLRHLRADGHPLQHLEVQSELRDLALYADRLPPSIAFSAPQDGALLNSNRPTIEVRYRDIGAGVDPQTLRFLANDADVALVCRYGDDLASCTPAISLPEGAVALTATVEDYAGNAAEPAAVRVSIDTTAPLVVVTSPAEGTVTRQPQQLCTGALSEPARLFIDGVEVPVTAGLDFAHGPVALQEGLNVFELVASDAAGNSGHLTLRVTLDTTPPQAIDSAMIETAEIIEGQLHVNGRAGSVEAGATVTVTNARTGQTVTVQAQDDGSFTATISAEAGDVLAVIVSDAAGNSSTPSQVPVASALPPDPRTVAPALDRTMNTDFANATAFLYSGSRPIQTGVAAETIEPRRVAVLRGQVRSREGVALAGVTVSILGHPEFGYTMSRSDGFFDLAVNGGGPLTVRYEKEDYLPSQRQVQVPWRDYAWLPEVVMLPYDARVTPIDLTTSADIQVARGSPVTDERGGRQATLLFTPGTQATMALPDGTLQALTRLNVRATEYTVGPNGPAAMPGTLPPASAYTYAVELSVDEAVAAGATTVRFSQPVLFYVENFLGFPVGEAVPVGYYDRDKGAWVASDNGRIIEILSVLESMAEIDADGDGAADDASTLASLGITAAERQRLAALYQPGQSLWRVPIPHFTPWDCNWPYALPDDALPPQLPDLQDTDQVDEPDCQGGSVIECQNQTLGETLDIAGTSLSLHYRSSRVPGRKDAYSVTIPLSGASVSPSLKRIDLVVQIAGRTEARSFPGAPQQRATFTWDGIDAYGRLLPGVHPATIRIGYVYDINYRGSARGTQSFGVFSESRVAINRARQEMTIWQKQRSALGIWDARSQGFGGWMLAAQHGYDFGRQVLHRGDGSQRRTTQHGRIITTVAGSGGYGNGGDGGPATQAQFRDPARIAVGPDGSLYIVDSGNYRVRRVTPDGIIHPFAGTGVPGYSGDGGPANLAALGYITNVELGPDGSLYISDRVNNCIRKVSPNGVITTVAGNGSAGFSGDGGSALQAQLNWPGGVGVAEDGTLYIADWGNSRVRRVSADGIITTVAGNGTSLSTGDGGLASQAQLYGPRDVVLGPGGSLYIAEGASVRRIAPDGIITTVAGADRGPQGNVDGMLATAIRLDAIDSVVVGTDGTFYVSDIWANRVYRVSPDGIITTLTGRGISGFSGDGGPAAQALFTFPTGMAIGPDGSLYIADTFNERIRRVAPPLPWSAQDALILLSEDGREVYDFGTNGRHLRTLNSLTGIAELYFHYDSVGYLVEIVDADGLTTTIERASNGDPMAIISPFGQRTTLTLDAQGYLASLTNPVGETTQLAYAAEGLLTRLVTPVGHAYRFSYDAFGRLIRDEDPAGGSKTLSRVEETSAFSVALANAAGQTHTYTVEYLPTGTIRRVATDPRGLQTVTEISADGSRQTTAPTGVKVNAVLGPDPRFGMLAPLTKSLSLTTPGGLTSTLTEARAVTLADPLSPLSLSTMTDTVTINGRIYTSSFDTASRQITNRTPAGRERRSLLDDRGRVIEEQLPGLHPLHFSYDGLGRLASVRQGTRSSELSYDAAGNVASLRDALSRTVSFEYDMADRLRRQTLPDGRTIQYTYDAHGNLSSLTPPGRSPHAFAYTAVDLAEAYLSPEIGAGPHSTQYVYNPERQPIRVLRPDGTSIDLVYDSAGRISAIVAPHGRTTVGYHPASGNVQVVTSPDGGRLTYEYDGSLLTRESWEGIVSGSIQRTYDRDFRLTTQRVNGELSVTFQYDADGLLTGAGALTLSRDVRSGLLIGTTLGMVVDARTYDGFGEQVDYRARSGAGEVLSIQYARDPLGRIIQKAETLEGLTTTYGYAYNAAGWLEAVQKDGVVVATYAYDENGNRISHRTADEVLTATYDAQDRLIQDGPVSYTYTLNGDLHSKTVGSATTIYDYDASGNLRSVALPSGVRIEYVIDGRNRRVGKKVNGALVQGFLYDGVLSPVAELDGAGRVTARFIYGAAGHVPDYMLKGGITYRILSDHLGSPRLVIDAATGHVVQRLFYDAFGRVIFDDNPGFQPFGFAGGLYDPDTRLTRFGARDYDAETGRWTAKDPILFAGGDTNLYGYVLNDPVNWVDPLGLQRLVIDTSGFARWNQRVRDWLPSVIPAVILDSFFPVTPEGIADQLTDVTGGLACPVGITISRQRLVHHVYKFHTGRMAKRLGKSVFFRDVDIVNLIRDSESVERVLQPNGKYERIVHATREIGIDRETGLPTSTYTVITDAMDRMVTTFPGAPKK